ncbi:MAG: adenosine kinase [Paludibacter sp.]|jgi:sugar/nucleoside kinase (ribokinase family)|nr:adenosine kinase [Paludibacter sp.]
MKKVLGIGNALTDILLSIENDNILSALNLPKGSMQLVNETKQNEISEYLQGYTRSLVTGGSTANIINGIVCLGGKAGYIGKVGNDEIGQFYFNDLKTNGVEPHLLYCDTPSGRCLVLISADGERTMCSYLGAAAELDFTQIDKSIFNDYYLFHIEGYLVNNHNLIENLARTAKDAGLQVSIDLASYNVVEANHDFLQTLVKNYVDIVFANKDEALAFAKTDNTIDALNHIAELTKIAVVKVGKDGSYIKTDETVIKIDSINANCIDTTGAGDLYASGFLYGLMLDKPLEICGKIGSIVSSNIVEVVGAKMDKQRWEKIAEKIQNYK